MMDSCMATLGGEITLTLYGNGDPYESWGVTIPIEPDQSPAAVAAAVREAFELGRRRIEGE